MVIAQKLETAGFFIQVQCASQDSGFLAAGLDRQSPSTALSGKRYQASGLSSSGSP
ncbi:MAG: hypothetical protein N838_07675 [Thiohalocapsa sp. PB-PSB1]|jgi:hypothetical protein|nr:MAG: hypothetical protein N838_07675 [Thiohalocapsa sp. PB-PSB1]